VGRQAVGALDARLRPRSRDPRRAGHCSLAPGRDAARDRMILATWAAHFRVVLARLRPRHGRTADRRRARRVLHLRRQPAPALPRRRRRRDLERAEQGPLLAPAVRRGRAERRPCAVRGAARTLLRRPSSHTRE
jgi:hypothetical protein